ncbi:MAG TPA: 1,4-dihydroxy-2-naphthoate octaprenyltransferase, partial [Polyangiaceae bacterium]|nr:1,4-dihydroxy-2-naphthoate octaprenyltransferase [Polyangiaceae bacterium]
MSSSAPTAPQPLSVRPGSLGAWLLASRPKTLSAAAVPVLVGTACASARGAVSWGPALAALFGALLLQIGANFANDVFDYEKGADTAARLGPTRAVQAGLISAKSMRRGMLLVFLAALGLGLYLTSVAGPVILLIGCASIASAIAYTGGPYPLGYHGLGD